MSYSKEPKIRNFIRDIERIVSPAKVIGFDFIAVGDDYHYFDYLLHNDTDKYLHFLEQEYFANNPSLLLLKGLIEKIKSTGGSKISKTKVALKYVAKRIEKKDFTFNSSLTKTEQQYWNLWCKKISEFYNQCGSIYFIKEDFNNLVQTTALFVYFDRDITSIGKRRGWLTKVSKSFLYEEAIEVFLPQQIKEIKRQAIRAAISQVMARNMSHNIGSHVLSRMVRWNDVLTLIKNYESSLNENWKTNTDDKEKYQQEFVERQIEIFNSYLKTRMDFLADIATSTPTIQNTKQFKSELLKGFDDNRLLLNKISGITDFNYTIKVFLNDTELTEGDFPVSISNDVLGFHAFYIILENIIRNTAKHSYSNEKIKKVKNTSESNNAEKIVFRIDVKDNDDVPDNSFYEITISDSICLNEPIDLTDDDLTKYKSILAKSDKSIKRIDKLVFDQNTRLNKSILDDETNLLRQGAWGLIEMDVSAAYLRKISQESVDDDKYQIPITLSEKKKYQRDKNREKLKIIEAVERNNCLGYRFYLPKPKELLIIDSTGKTWDTMFGKKQIVLNDWKNKGVLFLKESITSNDKWTFKKEISYPHELVLFLDSDKIFQSPFISKRQITLAELKQCYLAFHNKDKKQEQQIKDIDVLKLSQEDLITEVWRAWMVKQKKSKSIGKFDDERFDNFLPIEQRNETKYEFDFDNHGYRYDGIDKVNYYEIHPSQYKSLVEKIKKDENLQPDELNEKFKFLDSSLMNILVLDERIQQIALSESYLLEGNFWYPSGISYKEVWDKVNVYIPLKNEINLNEKNFPSTSLKDITNFANHRLVKGIRNHTTKTGDLSEDIDRVCYGIDFIVIHLGVIEKILKAEQKSSEDEKDIKNFIGRLNNEFPLATVIITSGRGKPKNLPKDTPYLGYSVISQYLIENRFKTLLTQTLYSSRPRNR